MSKTVLILERANQNLQRIAENGKVILEGIFAEFGVKNRNNRVYDEDQYLFHLNYLIEDMNKGVLVGELDHPEDRFEIQLSNASHKIIELWHDKVNHCVRGKIELLDTPKGKIAKTLLECGVPLSISSRAAGSVADDNSVTIDQMFTYDIVCKPGFEKAQLNVVNEGYTLPVKRTINSLNESYMKNKKNDISNNLGIVNENVTILDISNKYPNLSLRDEVTQVEPKQTQVSTESGVPDELKTNVLQQQANDYEIFKKSTDDWSADVNKELVQLNKKIDMMNNELNSKDNIKQEIEKIKNFIDSIKNVLNSSLEQQNNLISSIDSLSEYVDDIAETGNMHLEITNKLVNHIEPDINDEDDFNDQQNSEFVDIDIEDIEGEIEPDEYDDEFNDIDIEDIMSESKETKKESKSKKEEKAEDKKDEDEDDKKEEDKKESKKSKLHESFNGKLKKDIVQQRYEEVIEFFDWMVKDGLIEPQYYNFDIEKFADEHFLSLEHAVLAICNLEDTDVISEIASGNYDNFDLRDSNLFNDYYPELLEEIEGGIEGLRDDEDEDEYNNDEYNEDEEDEINENQIRPDIDDYDDKYIDVSEEDEDVKESEYSDEYNDEIIRDEKITKILKLTNLENGEPGIQLIDFQMASVILSIYEEYKDSDEAHEEIMNIFDTDENTAWTWYINAKIASKIIDERVEEKLFPEENINEGYYNNHNALHMFNDVCSSISDGEYIYQEFANAAQELCDMYDLSFNEVIYTDWFISATEELIGIIESDSEEIEYDLIFSILQKWF